MKGRYALDGCIKASSALAKLHKSRVALSIFLSLNVYFLPFLQPLLDARKRCSLSAQCHSKYSTEHICRIRDGYDAIQ